MKIKQSLFCLVGTCLLFSCKDKPINSPEFYNVDSLTHLKRDSMQIQTESDTLTVHVLRNDTIALYEGDMWLPVQMKMDSLTKKLRGWSIVGSQWSNSTLYYTINANSPHPTKIKAAIQHWTDSVPGIKFKLKEATTRNYVEFVLGTNPSSRVGMVGGRQEITISNDTSLGNIIHEIGHALGLFHEQSRSDRDKFVTVDTNNVVAKYRINYYKKAGESNDTDYDYGSIMHYPSRAPAGIAIDPQKAIITPKTTGVVIGQRTGLSATDIKGIKKRYGL